MFEQLVVSVLNSVLGRYIRDLDSSNLELAVLQGQAVLRDLELRDDALDGFDLPVQVTHGFVGEISLTIPWTNLYSSPCDICIEDVYLIASPVKEQPYDAEKARASELAVQRKRLRQIEESLAKKATESTDGIAHAENGDSFVEKLMAQVIKNLKISPVQFIEERTENTLAALTTVSVKNIHMRYEDQVTSCESPFAVGFTLQNLSAETTDDNWKTSVVNAAAKTVFKLVSLDNLAVYWNPDQHAYDLYGNHWNWKGKMEDGISTKAKQPKDYEYILQPLSAECHVIMDQTSKVEMDVPKLLVEVIQQELSLAMSQKQFHNLMDVIDSFELMSVNQQYKKYQPTVKVHGNASKWWKYAYTAICEEGIRSWSWERIKAHRARYRAYKSLYKRKLKGFHDSERESSLRHLQALEDDLGIPSVLIAKQQAELEVPPEMREVLSPAKTSSGSWWSWLGGEEDLLSKLTVEALPKDEKEKLYKAIDYSEGARPIKYPLEVPPEMREVLSPAKTSSGSWWSWLGGEEDLLSKLTVEALPKDEKEKLYKAIDYSEGARPIKYPIEVGTTGRVQGRDYREFARKIAEVATEGFAAAIEQRPGGDAMRFQAEVNGFQVLGTPNPSDCQSRPCLMSSKTSLGSDGKALLSFTAETNPLHVCAEYAVALKVEPVEIRYDNVTFVDMDVRSPYIVIPEYGNLARLLSTLPLIIVGLSEVICGSSFRYDKLDEKRVLAARVLSVFVPKCLENINNQSQFANSD
ncbi:predicted protein [Nematostella vectensis]|uniref:Chorein N-terminal domain-containing protein n=1 Tax=Nematostella vectensis TaxID=45351 RepID=A7SWL5_NEMVE|nr:predicted protein [Nematostella vectensis]|eukprot:XP_001624007.1 predicted protein [Nematostella vectensis]